MHLTGDVEIEKSHHLRGLMGDDTDVNSHIIASHVFDSQAEITLSAIVQRFHRKTAPKSGKDPPVGRHPECRLPSFLELPFGNNRSLCALLPARQFDSLALARYYCYLLHCINKQNKSCRHFVKRAN